MFVREKGCRIQPDRVGIPFVRQRLHVLDAIGKIRAAELFCGSAAKTGGNFAGKISGEMLKQVYMRMISHAWVPKTGKDDFAAENGGKQYAERKKTAS